MTTKPDEAQPRRRGGRRAIYPKRVELRMTQESFDLAEESAKRATEATGRTVTVSDVIRAAVTDGCARLAREQAQPVAPSSVEPWMLDALVEGITELRTEARRIGHNVNQQTRVAHATGQPTDDLDEVKAQLAAIDAKFMRLAATIAGVDG